MKKLLSIILVVCMMMTFAPLSYAATADFEVKTAETAYTAKVGETVNVPINLVPAASSADVCLIQAEISIPAGLTATVTAGKVPVTANSVNVTTTEVNIMYDAGAGVTYTAADSTMLTVSYTATEAGSYPITISKVELYDDAYDALGTQASNVTTTGATITFEANTPAVDPSESIFEQNSTAVKVLDFDSGNFTKDAKVTTAIDNFAGYNVDDVYYAATPERETGNLALDLYYDKTTAQSSTKFATWTVDQTLDTPYMVVSYKTNTNTDYNRVNIGFQYKDLVDGAMNPDGAVATTDTNGLPMIVKSASIAREGKTSSPYNNPENTGCDNSKAITENAYVGDWYTYTYVIDAVAKKAYLYVDDDYVMSLVIYRNRNHGNYAADLTTKYLAGVQSIAFAQDRSTGGPADKINETYYDDVQVRSMTAEQFNTVMADTFTYTNTEGKVTTDDILPVVTDTKNLPVTWTTDNADVTVSADGAISVADATVTYEDVVFTATYIGGSQTYTLDVMKEPKYAEYTFGATEDKAYGMTSYNVYYDNGTNGNFYTQVVDGIAIRNTIVDLGETRTLYYVANDPAATAADTQSHEVTKEEYDAFTGLKRAYNVRYYNTSASTGDSAINRYDAVGPEGDKRPAVMGVSHLRNDGRLNKKQEASKIHFNASETFTSADNALTIEVDVLDLGTAQVLLQYRTTAGTTVDVRSEALTDTGAWKTVTFTVADADFSKESGTGLGDQAQDFRINCGSKTYISAVRVYDVAKADVADADYTTVALRDYDVAINLDNTVMAKEAITAEEAADAKLYVAFYNEKGNLVDVAVSAQVTDGVAQTITTGSTAATFNTVDHTIKTFLWDSDLKPYR